jgi:hypothetical protein
MYTRGPCVVVRVETETAVAADGEWNGMVAARARMI